MSKELTKIELEHKIEEFSQQAMIAYSNGIDSVGDIYTAKVRELEEQLKEINAAAKEEPIDAPFRLKLFSKECIDHINEQKEVNSCKGSRFDCIGCERNCSVAVRSGYIGINEDGMTIYFPDTIEGGVSDD